MKYTQTNARMWDEANDSLASKARVISQEAFLRAKAGELALSLAGVEKAPARWFPKLGGCRVLALAGGGGQQGPVLAAHGAIVTVTDLSDRQLELERLAAKREGYAIETVKADLAEPFPFEDGAFDLIVNPVSNCYIRELGPMWRECARVLRPGGVLMTGFCKEELFLFDPDFRREEVQISRHPLPFDPLRDLTAEELAAREKERRPLAFSHSLTEQLGGLLESGFTLTDLYEDRDGGGLIDRWMKAYVVVRAVKKEGA